MKKLYFVFAFAATLALSSCVKEFGEGGKTPEVPGNIPADFDWTTTQNVKIAVAVPVANGVASPYAVVRIYASPALTADNLVMKGVTTPSTPFNTALTLPAGVKNIYVQLSLPDGTKAVRAVQAASQVNIGSIAMKSASKFQMASAAAREIGASSMPDYPTMAVKTEADFTEPLTIIRTTPNSDYDLGADYSKWSGGIAAPAYYIPAGAEITDNIGLNGGAAPFLDPVLYVAGKLTLNDARIGRVVLAVLPGGEVFLSGNSAVNNSNATSPAIYVFAGGKFTAENPNYSCQAIVNNGMFKVNGDLDLNGRLTFYNTSSAEFVARELKHSNNGKFYNDGIMTLEDLELNTNCLFENCENAVLTVGDCSLENGGTEFYQKGNATFGKLHNQGQFYVNCYTYAGELSGEQGKFFLSTGACLEADKTEFNNTDTDMAPGSLFITNEYNLGESGNNKFTNSTKDEDALAAVIRFEEKAVCRQGAKTDFSGGLIEVVYDASKQDEDYQIDEKKYFKGQTYLVLEQTVNIPKTECNGGKGSITPEQEPEPEDEYTEIKGTTYTYCFEDNWPNLGDYDMNDAVVVTSLDRYVSKDGSKVASIRLNWELKAAGTKYNIASAVRVGSVATSNVASVVSSHSDFGQGAFAAPGLEAGNDYAVVALFNNTKELLSAPNTWKGHAHAATTKHTTILTFAQPVDAAAVTESVLDLFIVVNSRSNEIHTPSFLSTQFGVVDKGSFLPGAPYKFFVYDGKHVQDNYMMWALMIPGNFRYPVESKDIRGVYSKFSQWAASNGTQYTEWYADEADESQLY